MRIVAGRHRGRSLAVPPGATTRPTSDRARQALFNILEHGVPAVTGSPIVDARVLDGFAGTGALALEALSRGARHATFFEQDRTALACLRQNITTLGEVERCTVIAGDIRRPPKGSAGCQLVFLDPPYGQGLVGSTLVALADAGWIAEDAVIIVELGATEAFVAPPGFTTMDRRIYSAAQLCFLRRQSHIRLKSL